MPGSSPAPDPVAAVLAAREEGRDLILATSGTTGVPRTVVRSTESWWASFAPYTDLSGVTAGSRVWVPGPLTGTMNLFAAVHARAVVVRHREPGPLGPVGEGGGEGVAGHRHHGAPRQQVEVPVEQGRRQARVRGPLPLDEAGADDARVHGREQVHGAGERARHPDP